VPKIDADLLRALSPMAVLLLIVLLIVIGFIRGWIRTAIAIQEVRADRDARLADSQQQTADWREAHRLSETAREKQAEALRESLEVARAAEDALKGFRTATAWAERERGGTA